MQKGKIGITTENIFPVIKKFLYSDHEIFLRELVSNAVDATQKLKTIASKGVKVGEMDDLAVRVSVDTEKKTITISDRGIGMTAEEVDKYINQIALSGANDFLEKYKEDAAAIIGHFGLGFYSSFMVAKRVDIYSLSYQEDAKGVHWSCDGSPEFEIEDFGKADRGTDIVLHLDDDCAEFAEKSKIEELLKKYCRYLPVPIVFGKKTEWKDGKQQETDEDNVVNVTEPLWVKTPSTLKDEDYQAFYRDLYPMADEPLFWIHLNVDYPFHLTGVLYFPKIKSNLDIRKDGVRLYCNQVYVTDHVENIVPEFLTLLHGVIDSPDIPLNVSRSYLQSDANVKKISGYIEKKVADRLLQIFKEDRKQFESKWDSLKLFIEYGMLSTEDFYDRAEKFALLKDVDGKYYTYEEYRELVKAEQTDKDDMLVCLYASDRQEQFSYIQTAQNKGYNVLLMDGQLDPHLVGMLEQKWEKTRFSRVDGDTIDRLIQKRDAETKEATAEDKSMLTDIFTPNLPKLEKKNFNIDVVNMGQQSLPVMLMQSEYMRRMKEMSRVGGQMSFYGEMADMFTLVLNADHPLIQKLLDESPRTVVAPIDSELKGVEARKNTIESKQYGEKFQPLTEEDKADVENCKKQIEELKGKKNELIAQFNEAHPVVSQLIDLALLQNGILKGEALDAFVRRSVDMMGA